MKREQLVMGLCLVMILSGCARGGILFLEKSSLSVSASVSSTNPELASMAVGYRRRVTAIVPEMNPDGCKSDGEQKSSLACHEAQSLISTFELKEGRGGSLVVINNFATGKAAIALAKKTVREDGTPASKGEEEDDKARVETLIKGLSHGSQLTK